MNRSLRPQLLKMTYAAFFLALTYVLPFLTGQVPQIGNMLCPMHFPVLLCGFVCSPFWGAVVGLIAPLLRSLTLGMPPLFPTALAMSFELCAYGLLAGLFCRIFPKKIPFYYLSQVLAMLGGRIVWGLATLALLSAGGQPFTLAAFWAGAFVNAVPGIILQLLIIVPTFVTLQSAGVLPDTLAGKIGKKKLEN